MHLTATQTKIITLLADGLPHTREELFACLPDDMGNLDNVKQHISNIRAKLKPRGEDVVSRLVNGKWSYQHVRLLASPNDGRT